jgi:hypothetical protein
VQMKEQERGLFVLGNKRDINCMMRIEGQNSSRTGASHQDEVGSANTGRKKSRKKHEKKKRRKE